MCEYVMKRRNGEKIIFKIGDKYNRLTIEKIYKLESKTYFDCICDCGNKTIKISPTNLITGNTKSCGCYNQELRLKRNTKHNDAHRNNKTRLYKIWVDMKRRCNNSNIARNKSYYNKGIKYCDEWENFSNFKEWSLKNNYQDNLTIERIDNYKNYEPNNCKWIPLSEQSKNRTTNHFLTYKNETHTLTDWSKIFNCKRSYIYSKLKKGMSFEEIAQIFNY